MNSFLNIYFSKKKCLNDDANIGQSLYDQRKHKSFTYVSKTFFYNLVFPFDSKILFMKSLAKGIYKRNLQNDIQKYIAYVNVSVQLYIFFHLNINYTSICNGVLENYFKIYVFNVHKAFCFQRHKTFFNPVGYLIV